MSKKISYYSVVNKQKSPGVFKKIQGTVAAFNAIGLEATNKYYSNSSRDNIRFLKEMLSDPSDVLIIRYFDRLSLFIFFIMIIKRCFGTKVIIDIPTPCSIALKEVNTFKTSSYKKLIRKCAIFMMGSWVFWPAHRVIQYAEEKSSWFSFGLKHKTLTIGNGIWIDENLPLVNPSYGAKECLNLIAVAQIANWHGYDRLIKALSLFIKNYPQRRVAFTIVGDGEAKQELVKLVEELNLQSIVVFTGLLEGESLNMAFNEQHIGVSSLGLYRIHLEEASVLKTREYMARGLSVIAAGNDPDFSHNERFRLMVPNNDSVDEIVELLVSLTERELPEPSLVRKFAEENLSMQVKVEKILHGLISY